MFVKVRNIGLVERSLPTPFSTSILLEPNEETNFICPKADMNQVQVLTGCDFTVVTITQSSDIYVRNASLNLDEVLPVIDECELLLTGTEVCDDYGIHVPNTKNWTDSESFTTFLDSYESAIEKLENADSQEVVGEVKTELESAKNAIEVLPGLLPSDPSIKVDAVVEQYEAANLSKSLTFVSETGDDLEDCKAGYWATQESIDTLDAALKAANTSINEASDQKTVDAAVKTLEGAVEAFRAALTVVDHTTLTAPTPEAPIANKTVQDLQEVTVEGTTISGKIHKIMGLEINGSKLNGYYLYLPEDEVDPSQVRLANTYRNSKMILATISGVDNAILAPVVKVTTGLKLIVKQFNADNKKAVKETTYDLSGLTIDE